MDNMKYFFISAFCLQVVFYTLYWPLLCTKLSPVPSLSLLHCYSCFQLECCFLPRNHFLTCCCPR